jgi:hypothetical protein
MIHDPLGSPFWSSEDREDTGTSLGEAVAFSLCCLANDALKKTAKYQGEKQIGISFPNWLVDDDRKVKAAARNFREAVAVALELVSMLPADSLPLPGIPFQIKEFKKLVNQARLKIKQGPDFNVTDIMKVSFSSSNAVLKWSFITESGAAGLPYLRAMSIERVPGLPGLAKLLVVDVGAGSTDIGYMLRTRNLKTGKESLYYFPPASSLPVAGNQLTHELMSHFRSRNERLTYIEAELMKLQNTGWDKLTFVATWKAQIGQHVQEYIEGLPDHRWLPMPVALNVVVTGGSGLVPGLKEVIKDSIRRGMAARKKTVDHRTIQKIATPGEHLPTLRFDTEAEYARRAVALGASDADRPGCTYIAEMEEAFQVQIQTGTKWV